MDGEDDDIFQELLDNKKQPSTTMPFDYDQSPASSISFQTSISPDLTFEPTMDPVLASHVEKNKWIILAHCWDDRFQYLLIDNDNYASIKVYHKHQHNAKSSKSMSQPNLCHSFQTALNSSLFEEDLGRGRRQCFLYSLHQDMGSVKPFYSGRNFGTSKRNGNIILKQSLFVYLFGHSLAFTQSPILMLCCNNGDVFSYAMENAYYGRLQLFCSVNSSVITVASVSLAEEEARDEQDKGRQNIINSLKESLTSRLGDTSELRDNSLDGLIVVGKSGECCLFIQPPCPGYTVPVSLLLHGPVVACLTVGAHIIYSNETCVKTSQLTKHQRGIQAEVYLQSHSSLIKGQMKDLQIQHYEEKQECHLMGITHDYDAVIIAVLRIVPSSQKTSIEFDFRGDMDEEQAENPAAHLKGSLHRLNSHTKAIKALQERSKHLDTILLQLNLFATISQQQKISKECIQPQSSEDNMVECHCELVPPQINRHKNWELKIELSNKSSVSFSNEWSLLITEYPAYICPPVFNSNYSSPAVNNFQFRLTDGLDALSKSVFIVPVLDSVHFDYLQDLKVSVSLVLCMNLPREDSFNDSCSQIRTPHQLMQVEIYRKRFDILDFLQTATSSQEINHFCSGEQSEDFDWLEKQLQKMAANRAGVLNEASPKLLSDPTLFTVAVDLPCNYVKENIGKDSDTDVLKSVLALTSNPTNEASCSFHSPNLQPVALIVDACDSAKDGQHLHYKGSNFLSLKVRARDVLMMFAMVDAIVSRTQDSRIEREEIITKQRLECTMQSLKDIRIHIMEDFNKIKFAAHCSPDYKHVFCHLLNCMKGAFRLDR